MLLEESFSPAATVRAIRDRRVTHLIATDDMLHAMLDLDADGKALRSLRMAGFAAFNGDPGTLMERCEAHGVPLVGLYGMSEVMALFAGQSPDARRGQRIKAAGIPVCPETVVRVRDPASGALLTKGETGALEIRTPNRMLCYFGNPEATAEAIDGEGFLRTGDAGYLDEAGFVFLARMGDALRLGGFLVAPEEIIARIDALPGVAASQAVGVTVDGKPRCAAFVIPEAGATVSGIRGDRSLPGRARGLQGAGRGLADRRVPDHSQSKRHQGAAAETSGIGPAAAGCKCARRPLTGRNVDCASPAEAGHFSGNKTAPSGAIQHGDFVLDAELLFFQLGEVQFVRQGTGFFVRDGLLKGMMTGFQGFDPGIDGHGLLHVTAR